MFDLGGREHSETWDVVVAVNLWVVREIPAYTNQVGCLELN